MIKSLKRLLVKIARSVLRFIPWTIQTNRKLKEKMGESKQQSEPQYLNEFHEKTTEDKIKHLQSLNPSEIDWEKELKQQKLNAHDDLPQKIIGSLEKNQGGMLRSQKLKAQAFKNVQEGAKQPKQQEKPLKLPSAMRAGLKAKVADRMKQDPQFRKRVEQMAESKKQQQSEPQYLTEAHRKNSEAAMKYLNSLNPSEIDWEKEIERQKRNARD